MSYSPPVNPAPTTYQQYTLDTLAGYIATLLDDQNEKYWTRQEKYYAIWEAMRVWGSLTNYWRTRGTFNLNPNPPTPYYDLSVLLPALRTRTWTLGQMTSDIQFMLLEPVTNSGNGSDISGAGMTGQVTIQTILNSIQRARNRFVLDTHLPISIWLTPSSPAPINGLVALQNTAVYVHKATWTDALSSRAQNLWREDAWAADKNQPLWTVEPGFPQSYSESELSPLKLQLNPPPIASGTVEVLTVDSLLIDTSNPASTFAVPDEWVYAIKYAALSELFSAESQLNDPFRAQYSETRYNQAVQASMQARSLIRLMANNLPLPLDSLYNLDSSNCYWRNQSGAPQYAGALYDIFAVSPGLPISATGMTADVVQSAPIPSTGRPILMGSEDIPHLIDYAMHLLTFKCGGSEFKSTFGKYDSFMNAAASRGQINKALIRYITPLFGQPVVDQSERPDKEAAA